MTAKHKKLSKKEIQKIRASYYSIHDKPLVDDELEKLSDKKIERYLNYEERWWHILWFCVKFTS